MRSGCVFMTNHGTSPSFMFTSHGAHLFMTPLMNEHIHDQRGMIHDKRNAYRDTTEQ